MDEDVIKLRAQLLKAEGALAEVTKERTSLAADVTRFKENMKRGDAELSKAIRAYKRRDDDANLGRGGVISSGGAGEITRRSLLLHAPPSSPLPPHPRLAAARFRGHK